MNTVLITGANKGIGLELVRAYLERGDSVLAACRDPGAATALQQLASDHPRLELETVEVAVPASVEALGQRLGDRALDILINNAGTGGPYLNDEPADALDVDGWLETFRVNTVAPMLMLRRLRANLAAADKPRAVSISSQMGAIAFTAPHTMYAYSASKAALNKIMHMLARDLAADGIAVQLVHPGWVQTDMGGKTADITPAASAAGIVAVTDSLTLADSGRFMKWNGEPHPW